MIGLITLCSDTVSAKKRKKERNYQVERLNFQPHFLVSALRSLDCCHYEMCSVF